MVFGLFRKPRRAIEGTGDYRQEIVGESNYRTSGSGLTFQQLRRGRGSG